jgi:ribosomal protein S10
MSWDPVGLRRVAADMRSSEPRVIDAVARRVYRAGSIVTVEIKRRAPIYQGTLVQGIDHATQVVPGRGIIDEVTSTETYWLVQERGRLPGKMPPDEPIRRWVQLKLRRAGGDERELDRITYLIRRKIGRSGTKAKRYIALAWRASRGRVNRELDEIATDVANAGLGV